MAATTAEEEEEEDRISSLSDDVLNHILSFLPTKTSVETSTLSRRWRHLWKDLSFLNFSDHSNKYLQQLKEEQFKTFALFVNGVLTHLRNPRGIRKMTLECALSVNDKFRYYSVDMWVRAAIGPCLEELMLSTFGCGYTFELPQTLFTSTNLASLSLCGGFHVYVQSSTTVSLPSLKLLLIDVGYMEVPSLNALLCGCPNIEILNLCCFAQSIDIDMEVPSLKVCVPPSLKRLRIDIDNDAGTYLEISAPALEYLNISTITFGEVCSMYNLHNVVEACLDVFPQSFGSVIPLHNLLGALSGTKHLVLSRSTTKWLLGKPHDLLFQEFRYLFRLKLKLPWFNSNSLLSLLQKCPMLQVLIIKNDKKWSPDLGWAPQSSVPNCLVSHLTFIKFKGLRGFEELSFVEHVLQKGLVLKTMIIADISLELRNKYNILKRLSNVPRASETCQLTFD